MARITVLMGEDRVALIKSMMEYHDARNISELFRFIFDDAVARDLPEHKDAILGAQDLQQKRLTQHQVEEIDYLLKQGELTGGQIARKFGVSKQLISRIKNGHSWSNITKRRKKRRKRRKKA